MDSPIIGQNLDMDEPFGPSISIHRGGPLLRLKLSVAVALTGIK
jgi:hypothetical protein